MKKVLLIAAMLFAGSANAAEITSRITDSVSLKINPNIVVSQPTSASYTVSGTNVTATTLGGLNTAGTYSVKNDGQAFNFSETSTQASFARTVQTEGTAGNMAGSLSPTGVGSITAGGNGSEAVAQRSIELSVFK